MAPRTVKTMTTRQTIPRGGRRGDDPAVEDGNDEYDEDETKRMWWTFYPP